MSTNQTASPRWTTPLLLLAALVLLAVMGAGAIALERPVGQANGQVVAEATGRPLPDAKVTAAGPVTRTAVSGPDGRFRFTNMPVGSYMISAKAPRYDMQWFEGEVKVEEGKVAGDLNFRLARTQPSLEVANVQRVFLPDEPVRIAVRGTQVPNLEVALYRLNVDQAVGKADDLDALRRANVNDLRARGLLTPVKSWNQTVQPGEIGDDYWFYKPIQMPELPVGQYVVSVGGMPEKAPEDSVAPKRLERGYWFTISRLALVTKRAGPQLLLYSVDLVSKRPVPGARVRVLGAKGVLDRGQSDREGLTRFEVPSEGNVVALASNQGSDAVAQSWASSSANPFRIYAYTDRPVYRPGQKVYFKGIVRAQHLARYSTATGQSVRMVLKDASGNQLVDQLYPVGGQSDFHGELTLPEEAPLGEYSAELTIAGGSYEDMRFKVADYRKPEFQVEITPAKPRYRLGETADVNLLASYYFGAPVPGARLNVTVYSAPLYDKMAEDEAFYAGYTSEPGIEPVWGFGDVVYQTEGTTDADGRLRVQVPIEKPEPDSEAWRGDRVYTVSVEAMDASQRPVKATESFRVTQGDIRINVETDQSLYTAKTGMGVIVRARDYDDHPVKTEVTVTAEKLIYEDKKTAEGDEYTETRRELAFTGRVTTGADGVGRLKVPPLSEGSYVVMAKAIDARGNAVFDETWTWVAGEAWTNETYRHGALQLVLDKKVYRPGDQAKVLIVSPVPDVSVLLTVEGVKLHSARVLTLKGASTVVTVPVTAGFKPNAFVTAAVVNGKEFMETERSLNVVPEEQFLNISIKSDKQRYEPGETATYTVETRDWKGRPVSADVSLGVVDQAIYAIEPDHTPDIRGFFHGPRWNTVSTGYSFAEDYSGGLDKFAPDPRVRARFEDTAAWYPSLRTGADGTVRVSFKLPDNLTTWVATARAATLQTQVGATAMNVVATKELLVRLETPRFLVMGDHVQISAIVHNYTEQAQRVRVRLESEGLDLRTEALQERSLGAGDAQRLAWDADVPTMGAAKARVIVNGQTAADAMELPIPVLPYGVEKVEAFAGEVTPDQPAMHTLTLGPGALPPTEKLTIRPHTTPLPAILSAVTFLHHYEYGCVEQTMSRFLPDVAIPRRLAEVDAPTEGVFDDQVRHVREGLRRLLSMQHGDGGWGWWSQDESKVEMTAYVLYGLAESRRGGFDVPDTAVNRAIDYLKRQLPKIQKDVYTRETVKRDAGADLRAFAIFSLSQWKGATPPKEVDRLWGDRQALSHYGQAQLALALASLEDFRRFEALDALEKSAEQTETQVFWPSDAAAYSWQDNSVETTAYALRAYMAISPDAAAVPKIVRWLVSQNVRGYWDSTKDSGAAAIALADYIAVRRPDPAAMGPLRIVLNDEEVALVTPGVDPWAPPAPVVVGGDKLKVGPNVLKLSMEGEGRLDYAVTLNYIETAEKLPAAPAKGLSVARDYFLLPADVYARAKGEGGFGQFYNEKIVANLPKLGDRVKAGERVLVRLTVKSDHAYRYMALEDPLPAGCEVLEDQPPNWGYWWDQQEYRDEKAVFFFNRLAPGTKTLYYVMRPTTQGRFRVLPTSVWAMYTPELRARGAAGQLTITE